MIKRKRNNKLNNIDYFDNIDRESKAYWFGYIFTKGSISKNSYDCFKIRIYLHKTDENFIQEFYEIFDRNFILKNIKGRDSSTYIEICNTKFVKNLIEKGGTLRYAEYKYNKILDLVPNDLVRHFLRGYIDGFGKYFITGRKLFDIKIFGSYILLDEIQQIFLNNIDGFEVNKISKDKKKTEHKGIYVRYGGNPRPKKIIDFLYKDATIYLDKNYKIIKEYYGDVF